MVKITWIGHSCFKVKHRGYIVIFDPAEDDYVPGIAPIREEANMVICSHEHGDHNARALVTKPKGLIGERGCPYDITEIHTYHDEEKGAIRGENTISILDDGEIRFAHFGDLGCSLTVRETELLKDLDFIFIPVGGYYTIDGKKAAEICKTINPKVIIPMHFRDDNLGFGFDVISDIGDFIEEFDNVVIKENSELEYDPVLFDGDPLATVLVPKNLIRT